MTPLYDHSFKTIGYMTEQSRHFIPPVLKRIEEMRKEIGEKYSPEAARNAIEDDITYCLNKCLAYFNPAHNMTATDYHVYFQYAANAAAGIDNVIANEMPDL